MDSQESSSTPSSKASTLQHSAFFVVQLSHPYMTTGKTKALTGWTFVGKVMSQLFNLLPRLVIAFLPRNKRLLISWLHSPSAVILEPPKIKSVTVSIVSPTICHEVIGPDAMILVFWMLSFKPTFSMQCWRPWFNLWVGKIPWKREWQSTPGSFPGESHGQRSLAGFSPWGHKESDMTERLTHSRYLITYWMLPIFSQFKFPRENLTSQILICYHVTSQSMNSLPWDQVTLPGPVSHGAVGWVEQNEVAQGGSSSSDYQWGRCPKKGLEMRPIPWSTCLNIIKAQKHLVLLLNVFPLKWNAVIKFPSIPGLLFLYRTYSNISECWYHVFHTC